MIRDSIRAAGMPIVERIRSMRVGFTGSFYPVPKEVPTDETASWLLERSIELGCRVLQLPMQPERLERINELSRRAKEHQIELELTVPGAFQLAGALADEAGKMKFRQGIEHAKQLGIPIIRTAYGRLNIETSRFHRPKGIREHLEALVPTLREAAAMVRDAGLLLAVENHCDFTGRELAQLLDLVDSPHVGAALDTGNGYTVFCDPNDDVAALAPYTFTTHLKDMNVVKNPLKGGIPFTAFGCTLGEGHVDLAAAIELLARHSPCAEGLHLIVEPGWMVMDPSREASVQSLEFFEKSIRYVEGLKDQLGRGQQG